MTADGGRRRPRRRRCPRVSHGPLRQPSLEPRQPLVPARTGRCHPAASPRRTAPASAGSAPRARPAPRPRGRPRAARPRCFAIACRVTGSSVASDEAVARADLRQAAHDRPAGGVGEGGEHRAGDGVLRGRSPRARRAAARRRRRPGPPAATAAAAPRPRAACRPATSSRVSSTSVSAAGSAGSASRSATRRPGTTSSTTASRSPSARRTVPRAPSSMANVDLVGEPGLELGRARPAAARPPRG